MNRNQMNRFTMAPTNIDIGRSIFDRDHSVKLSFDLGELIPFYLDEVLPGDSFSVDTSKVVRVQPLVTPIMDNIYLDTYYFFVPTRLVWSHFVNFMGESENAWIPQNEYTIPMITVPYDSNNQFSHWDVGTIADYMGLPIMDNTGKQNLKVSVLPFRAYAKIVDDWFRDQNLMNPVSIHTDDTTRSGSNGSTYVTDLELGGKPFVVCKYHDYFTSCLPAPQKGPAITLGIGAELPVMALNEVVPNLNSTKGVGDSNFDARTSSLNWYKNTTSSVEDSSWSAVSDRGASGTGSSGTSIGNVNSNFAFDYYITPSNLWVDTTEGIGITINEMRTAFAVQKYYEKLARSGSRYIETVRSFFGVTSPDARLQRSEYLGGNRVPLNISQVENVTNQSTNIEPIGSVAGMSVTGDTNSDFTKSFTEHGYIIGVCCARINHTYQDGVERLWTRKTVFDFYNPVFANIGEQPVDRSQIYGHDHNYGYRTFGYQEAWAEYRYKPSRVAGEMRSRYATSLDMWHLADDYQSAPTLSASWIQEDKTVLDRCLAVTSSVSNQFIADFYIECKCSRPMPLYSIPGLIDHH